MESKGVTEETVEMGEGRVKGSKDISIRKSYVENRERNVGRCKGRD